MVTSNELKLYRVPPQDLDAEQMVLGAVLIENQSLHRVKDLLASGDFYRAAHGNIFEAMLALGEKNDPIDLVTMSDALRGTGTLDNIGGASYLATLVSLVPTAANIRYHAKIVATKKQLRDGLHACNEALGKIYSLQEPDQIFTELITRLNGSRSRSSADVISQRELMQFGFFETEKRYENRGKLSGIPTGITDLDVMLDGLQTEDLIVIAGRPSMGKSAFAETISDNVARFFLEQNSLPVKKVGYISIEQGKRQLALRALSRMSGVPNTRIRRGELGSKDWDHLATGVGTGSKLPIVYVTSAMDDRSVERSIDVLVQQHGCGIIEVDYLQLMRSDGDGRNREQEVSAQSRMLKSKAKQHKIPVIALAQLNRSLENRVDKKPILADLRESGAIEQDADVIIFMYREEVYKPCVCLTECLCGRRGKALAIVRKQRMGPCGEIEMIFDGKTTSFRNAEAGHA